MKKYLPAFIAVCLIASFYFVAGPTFFSQVFSLQFLIYSMMHAVQGIPFLIFLAVMVKIAAVIHGFIFKRG